MSKYNFGSQIVIQPPQKGTNKHGKYGFIAHANIMHPEIIFLNQHKKWFNYGSKRMQRVLNRILIHEVVHQLIWDLMPYRETGSYDYLIHKFQNWKICGSSHYQCVESWYTYRISFKILREFSFSYCFQNFSSFLTYFTNRIGVLMPGRQDT